MRLSASAPLGRAALALVLALVVPAAPLARSAASACEVCPRDCPMHATQRSESRGCHHGATRPSSRHCHQGPLAAQASDAGAHATTAHDGWKRPGCGTHRPLPVAWLAEAVLPRPVPHAHLAVHGDATAGARGLEMRAADPPESPPPIVRS